MSLELLQKGNSKLGKDMLMFNIPASKQICGRLCPGCYAYREQQRYPRALSARQSRYEASLQLDFVSRIRKEINSLKTKPKYVRIHASGEFYSQVYLDNWTWIVKSFPEITFYLYTKRKKDFDFSRLEKLSNAIVINSFHFGGLNYGSIENAPEGAFICPHQKRTSVQCGKDCTYCMKKEAQSNGVFFIKH